MTNVSWDPTLGLPNAALAQVEDLVRLPGSFDHPVALSTNSGGIVTCAGEAGQHYRLSDTVAIVQELGDIASIASIAVDGSATFYLSSRSTRTVLRLGSDGLAQRFCAGTASQPMRAPTGLAFGPDRRLYVADAGRDGSHSCIFRVEAKGRAEVWSDEPLQRPEAIAWHPDNTHLYIVEQALPGVSRIERLPGGGAGRKNIVVELPHNVPTGLAFDEARSLFISCRAPDVVYRLNFDGELAVLVADWERKALDAPSGIAFAGNDRSSLIIANGGSDSLMSLQMPVRGAELHYPPFA